MEKINTESLVASLFAVGFDKVDNLLYAYTLGELSIDNSKKHLFELENCEVSQAFNEYVDYDGIAFKLKDGFTLDTNVSPKEGYTYPLSRAIHVNPTLTDYLSGVDFRKIILKKIGELGPEQAGSFPKLFSDKEKEIISDMFDIGSMYHQRREDQENELMTSEDDKTRSLYDESAEIEEIIKNIQRRKKERNKSKIKGIFHK